MFLILYRGNGGTDNGPYAIAQPYLEMHPLDLSLFMDQIWGMRDRQLFPETIPLEAIVEVLPGNFVPAHLIYAYMIENTRAYEIVERVIFEYLHGEKLGFPARAETVRWLRATEELFYKVSSNYLIQSIISNIKQDIRAQRRNAYCRLFGMDLNHGVGGTSNYPYHKPASANKEFVSLFEELLSEIWIGIAYADSMAAPNLTDEAKMNDLIVRISELLTTRKQAGNLYREEFYHTATMSWLHLTLLVQDAPIFQDMAIAAESPAERLRQMGERIGYPAHPKADAFFKMAEDLSTVLTEIERIPNLNCQYFIAPAAGAGLLRNEAARIITQWSIASGKDLKSLKVRSGAIGAPGR